MTLVSWTLSFLRPYRARTLWISVLCLAEIGLAALAPWPLKVIVDNVLGGQQLPGPVAEITRSTVGDSLAALLILVVVIGLLIQISNELVRIIHTQLQVDMAQRIVYKLRSQLLHHLQALPLRHHILTKTADSVYRLDADAHCVDDLIIGGVFPLTLAIVNLGVMFSVLVYLDVTLALLSLVVVPFLYLSLRYYTRTMTDRAERVKVLESSVVERAFEILSTISAVKSFARERHEVDRFAKQGHDTMQERLGLTWQESIFSLTVTTITLGGTALVLVVGGLHVLDGSLTLGSLLIVIAYIAAVYNPISEIAHTTGSLRQAVVSARRVREIFSITPEPLDLPNTITAPSIRGHIRFDRVNFAYEPASPVLANISFEVKPGELVALVGISGAGKTTIANLIPRLFEPTAGHVSIDGTDLADYSLQPLREQIATVPQNPILFTGSIADNIRYGRLDASMDDIRNAARAAHIHHLITGLAHGYETVVAEGGASLSGGERQRLGIARAFLKNAPILILDEPTSSMDTISESEIFSALESMRTTRTILVIAHRLSTIKHATRILVLQKGQLVAQGTHLQLMDSNNLYQQMWRRLSAGRLLDDPETMEELMKP